MFDSSQTGGRSGVSTPVGVTIMVVIVVLLATLLTVMTTDIARSTQEGSQVHGVGTFDIEFEEGGDDTLNIEPEALQNKDTTYIMEVNDHRVHEWNGHEPLDFTCLYPGDHIEIISKEGSTTYPVQDYRVEQALSCERIRPLPEKFEYAYIDTEGTSKKVRVQPEFTFGIEIDPDGPGADSTHGHPVSKQNIATIPVTNQWHYIRKYDKKIEGLSPPVWVIVMVDNVHWKGSGGAPVENWTDDPMGAPGKNSYTLTSTGSGHKLNPISTTATEPTNDIFMVFKPGCSGSKLRLVNVEAGYTNRIYINDKVAIADTSTYDPDSNTPVTLNAPAVNCPTGSP